MRILLFTFFLFSFEALFSQQNVCGNDSLEEVEEWVYIPSYTRKITFPPVYRTITEKVLVRDQVCYSDRHPCSQHCSSLNPDDCKDTNSVPPSCNWKTITKQIVVIPAKTMEKCVPARYEMQKSCQAKTNQKLSIYPNPAKDQLNLSFPATISERIVEIWTIQGQLYKQIVLPNTRATIDINDWNKGVYILKYANKSQLLTLID